VNENWLAVIAGLALPALSVRCHAAVLFGKFDVG
jgi:hypothetical protein